jgi:hypothetical protein
MTFAEILWLAIVFGTVFVSFEVFIMNVKKGSAPGCFADYNKWVWLLLVIGIPIISIPVYFLVARPAIKREAARRAQQ